MVRHALPVPRPLSTGNIDPTAFSIEFNTDPESRLKEYLDGRRKLATFDVERRPMLVPEAGRGIACQHDPLDAVKRYDGSNKEGERTLKGTLATSE